MPICSHPKQLRDLVSKSDGDGSNKATVRFLLDQYLNAIAPSNFALTNPDVVARTKETNGANLVQGFAHLLEDLASGKGLVRRRTDPDAFEKGKTIAATPGQVVFQNDLFQLIQYEPATKQVAAEPLLYVPPLVNRYYMIDLVPRLEPGQMAGRRGPHGVRDQLGQPDQEASRQGRRAIMCSKGSSRRSARCANAPARRPTCSPSASAGLWSRSRLAWLAAKGRADEVNSATLIGVTGRFRRHARLVGIRPRRPSRGARGSSRGPGLHRQRRAAAAVRGDARQRFDLVVGGQPLSARQAGAAVGPALLVRGWRAHPGGLPQELQPRPAAQQQPQGPGRVRGRRRADRPRRDQDADAGDRAQGRPCFGLERGLSTGRAHLRRRFRARRIGP